jgi:sugar phosphate permease
MMAACTIVLVISGKISLVPFVVLCALIYFAMYAGYSLVFSMMAEGGVPEKSAGTAIGIVCTLGYLPEVICPVISGKVLDSMGTAGYKSLFIWIAVMMVIGIIGLILWDRHVRKLRSLRQAVAQKADQP